VKIAYVCTNYNNTHYSREAVRSLLLNTGHSYEIVIVDNASAAPSIAELQALAADFPDVHLILNQDNVGYFRGLNLGIAHLRRTRPDIEWMVVGNNDLEFPADFADRLESNSERWRRFPVVCPDIVTPAGEHQNPHVISGISPLREVFYSLYYSNYFLGLLIHRMAMRFRSFSDRSDESEWEIPRPIYQGHGSCYLLGPAFFSLFEELWAPTLLMSEEFFLSKQLADAGHQAYYDPAIRVIHHWHGALNDLPNKRRWALARDAHREYRKYVKIFG